MCRRAQSFMFLHHCIHVCVSLQIYIYLSLSLTFTRRPFFELSTYRLCSLVFWTLNTSLSLYERNKRHNTSTHLVSDHNCAYYQNIKSRIPHTYIFYTFLLLLQGSKNVRHGRVMLSSLFTVNIHGIIYYVSLNDTRYSN